MFAWEASQELAGWEKNKLIFQECEENQYCFAGTCEKNAGIFSAIN